MATCRTCGATIDFIHTIKGKLMPVDMERLTVVTEKGEVVNGRKPHWVTCPHADSHRKKGQS